MERSRSDYYRVLQVDPAANQLVIQAAYRVLAQIFHPDVSGDDAEMKRINAAWEVLGDPKRRRQYDIERAGRHPGQVDPHAAHGGSAAAAAARSPAHSPAARSHAGYSTAPHAASGSSPFPTPGPAAARPEDHAGPPVGTPFGPVLRFGRYEGWSLGQVARVDRPFLEWLRRVPAGRGLKDEIDAVLKSTTGPGAVDDRRRYETDRRQHVHTWAPGAPTKVR